MITRTVSCTIDARVLAPTDITFAVAVADGYDKDEQLTIALDGRPLTYDEVSAPDGGRLHVVPGVGAGDLRLEYAATVTGTTTPEPMSSLEGIVYRRPSRYSDSDKLSPVAANLFAGLTGKDLIDAVSSWVGSHLQYVSGSSRPIDGAVDSYLARAGVCRDFAHLVVAFLRARDVPARLVSVYAPGLKPMDFHAVAEAFIEGAWHVVDATTLAPRETMVRIATGRDAADTAFMTNTGGAIELGGITVTAVADPALPGDDVTKLVQLG